VKRTGLTIAATLAFGLCALAQQKPSNDPRTAPPGADPNTMPTQQTPDTASSPQTSASDSKGDKKLKGCLRSQGGSIVLEEKKGKQVALTGGQDLAAHVGHTVVVHGSYAGAAGAPGTATSTAGASGAGDQFTVSRIDMVSETCSADKAKDKTAQPQ